MSMLDVAIRRARAGRFPVNVPAPPAPPVVCVPVIKTTNSRKPWGVPLVEDIRQITAPGQHGSTIKLQIVTDIPPSLPPVQHVINRIVQIVSVRYGISKAEILSPQRTDRIVLARHIVMYIAKKEAGVSLPQIGKRLGGKDHTTVLHGVRRIAAKIASDTVFAEEIEAICKWVLHDRDQAVPAAS